MEEKKLHYDAFISYRHMMPDRAVAERIQRKLEGYRLPKEVAKKIGRNRLDRVFRDEAELSVSDDLSETITEALENSDYLIVIASPKYLESPWCMKEVETFIKIKDRKHILVALADGEPENAFPKVLTFEEIIKTDENGNEIKETITHEPLAADCRAEKTSERNKKVDLAVIRLIASIFSLNFDDLKQRQKEAEIGRRRRTAIITIAILLAIVAQALYFLGKISKQNIEIKEKNEAALAASANTLFSEGKRMDAVYTARSILPDKYNKNINNEAYVALVNALEIYTKSDSFVIKDDIQFDQAITYIRFSESGRYAAVNDVNSKMLIIDTDTGEQVADKEYQDISIYCFDGDKGILYNNQMPGESKIEYRYFDFKTFEEKAVRIYEDGFLYSIPKSGGVALVTDEKFYVISEGEVKYAMDYTQSLTEFGLEIPSREVYFSDDGKYAIMFFNYSSSSKCSVVLRVSLLNGKVEHLATMDTNVSNCAIRGNKMVTFSFAYDDAYYYELNVMNINSGKISKYKQIEDYAGAILMNNDTIMLAVKDQLKFYDLELNLISTKAMQDDLIYATVTKNGLFYTSDISGEYYLSDGKEFTYGEFGSNRSKIYTNVFYADNQIFVNMYGTNYISVYGKKDSQYMHPYHTLENVDFFDYADNFSEVMDTFKKNVADHDKDLDQVSIMNSTCSLGGNIGVVQTGDGQLRIYDRDTYKLLHTTYSIEGYLYSVVYSPKDKIYVFNTDDDIDIFDENLNRIINIPDFGLFGIDRDTKDLVFSGADELYLLDIVSYEEMIRMADELLGDYEPNERTKEKYGL